LSDLSRDYTVTTICFALKKGGSYLLYLLAVFSFLLFYLLRPAFSALFYEQNKVQQNYRGKEITFPWGLPLIIVLTATFLLHLLIAGPDVLVWQAVLLLYLAGFLGLADDVLGDHKNRGFAGHFKSFLRQRRLTTGMIKAVLGLLFAVVLSSERASPSRMLITALNLALCMNAINLLDVAPGRAGKGFLFALLLITVSGSGQAARTLGLAAVGALLAYLPVDLSEQGMLGDTGANALGGLLGLILIHDLSLDGQIISLFVLIAVHVLATYYSISQLINHVPYLLVLDRLGRIRK
jgi:UDP-GlcNAc:undecaprenyl-phosphate GlcNAc-1-phosphate transferase